MSYSVEKKSEKEGVVEVFLSVPWVDFEPFVKDAGKKISSDVEIQGFRKGQAPLSMIEEKIGWEKIYREAAFLALEHAWQDIVKTITQRTVGRPRIDIKKIALHNDLEVSVFVSLRPEIKLPDYKKIAQREVSAGKDAFSVSNEDVEKAIDWLRRSRASYVAVVRGAKKGDYVEIEFQSKIDGKEFEGGSSLNHPFILGSGHFMPGFEDNIEGVSAGEKKEFSLVAPSDYYRKELAGKKIDFVIILKSVQEVLLPAYDDEFAKNIGKFPSKKELEENIKQGLEEEKREKDKKALEEKIIQEIIKGSSVSLPSLLVLEETDSLLLEMAEHLERSKVSLEEYCKRTNQTMEQLKEKTEQQARRNLQIAFVLQAIASNENITVTNEEIDKAMERQLEQYGSIKEAKKKNIDLASMRVYTENTLLNKKVIDFLVGSHSKENKS